MNPYWLEEPRPARPEAKLDGRADVAIVGAGVTAAPPRSVSPRPACAFACTTRAGSPKARAGATAASRSAAARRATTSPARRTAPSRRPRTGAGPRRRSTGWPSSRATRCARTGSYRLAADEEEREGIRLEYEALREDGFDAEWLDDVPGGAAGLFHGAISHPHDGSIQPARFVRRLAALAAAAGAEFREHDPVEDVEALDADRVLVATDGYGHGLVPELADLVWPTRGQVIVSEPLDRVLYDRPHYARQGFDYWQQLPDGRILLGGFRDVSILDELTDVEETTPTIQASLESFLHELAGEEVGVTHRWAGIFGLTQDVLPLVGSVPGRDDRVWVAGGYSGHGNVLGFACGELVADAILGRESPQLELLDPARFFA